MAREQLQTLSEPMYFILLALTKRPMHGYEIMQTVSAITGVCVRVGAGTLYALLTRFENEKVIVRIGDDGRRKTYALTEAGRGLLAREYARLAEAVAIYDRYISKENSI